MHDHVGQEHQVLVRVKRGLLVARRRGVLHAGVPAPWPACCPWPRPDAARRTGEQHRLARHCHEPHRHEGTPHRHRAACAGGPGWCGWTNRPTPSALRPRRARVLEDVQAGVVVAHVDQAVVDVRGTSRSLPRAPAARARLRAGQRDSRCRAPARPAPASSRTRDAAARWGCARACWGVRVRQAASAA